MNKAKPFWIIYLIIIVFVALFATLIVNQGMFGMFSVKDNAGKIEEFNSYIYLSFQKIEAELDKKFKANVEKYEEKKKKRVEYITAISQLEKVANILAFLQNKDTFVKKIKKQLADITGKIAGIAKGLAKLKGAAKTQAEEQIAKLREELKKVQDEEKNISTFNDEAEAIAKKIKEAQPSFSGNLQEAVINEKDRLEKIKKNYDSEAASYENELFKLKITVDKYRILQIFALAIHSKAKNNDEIKDYLAVIDKKSVFFILTQFKIDDNSLNAFRDVEIADVSNDTSLDVPTEDSINELKKQLKDSITEIDKIVKKLRTAKPDEANQIKEEIKTKQEAKKVLEEKIKNTVALKDIFEKYKDIYDNVSKLFEEYVKEVKVNVAFEDMPYQNFLTEGIFLGKWAESLAEYKDIVKEQLRKNKMELRGVHRIEERLLGNTIDLTKTIVRRVHGIGEILKYKLADTELNEFVKGFNVLNVSVEQSLAMNHRIPVVIGTTGGGGQAKKKPAAATPPSTEQQPAAQSGTQSTEQQPAATDTQTTSPSQEASQGTSSEASQSTEGGELSEADKKLVLAYNKRIVSYYENLKTFFESGATVKISAGIVKNATNALRNFIQLFKEMGDKHVNILKQKPIDNISEGAMGETMDIYKRFETANTKLAEINNFIDNRVIRLTTITGQGGNIKTILILIFAILGGVLAFFTYRWEKQAVKQS